GKRKAVVVDDQTLYGRGVADLFAQAFVRVGGQVVHRSKVTVGQKEFQGLLAELPKDFDVLFFGGIAEAALVLRDMRAAGLNQLFACGDGCWDLKAFVAPAQGAATRGEGVLVLSAAPAVGRVAGSAEFASRYQARYGPIANYAVNAYDSARLVLQAIETAARQKGGLPTRAEVTAALGGCYVVPPGPPFVAAPAYVAPAPVYVAPAPVYVYGGYGWGWGWRHGYRRW